MELIADLCHFSMVQVVYNNNPVIPMSAHYKLPWFVSRASSASPHLPYSKGTGWSVSNLSSAILSTMATAMPSSPYAFSRTALVAFTPTFKLQYLLTLSSFVRVHV